MANMSIFYGFCCGIGMKQEGGLSSRREGKGNKIFTNVCRNGDVSKDGETRE